VLTQKMPGTFLGRDALEAVDNVAEILGVGR